MPKMQVYLPAALYQKVKARTGRLNVSSILQRALEEALAAIERQEALDRALRAYEKKHGKITDAELRAREEKDAAAARRPRARSGGKSAA
jgi:hypothetical protein